MRTVTSNRRLLSDFVTTVEKYRINGSVQMNGAGLVIGLSGSISDHTGDQSKQVGQVYLVVDSYGDEAIERELIVSGVTGAIESINREAETNESN